MNDLAKHCFVRLSYKKIIISKNAIAILLDRNNDFEITTVRVDMHFNKMYIYPINIVIKFQYIDHFGAQSGLLS